MAVKIRMKRLGRKHRAFFRICAVDSRRPRDGRVLEELGTYDPQVPLTDARVQLNRERVAYWLGVGAEPSEKVAVFIKKYGQDGTHLDQQAKAREQLAMPKEVPPMPEPVLVPKKQQAEEAAAAEGETQAAETAVAEEAPAEPAASEESAS